MSERPDFNALIGRLRAARWQHCESSQLVPLCEEAADLLEKARKVLETVPDVIASNRVAAQVKLTESVVKTLMTAADKYDSGELPVTTAATALRSYAAGMASALQETEKRARPGAPKKRGSIVGLHS